MAIKATWHVKLTRGDHARTAFTDYLNRVPKRGAIETVHVDGERVKLRIDVVHPALISPRIIRDREETFPLRGLNPRASKPRPRGLTEIRGRYHFDWTNSTSSKELGHRT
jgi:hypothetical protein